MESRTEKKRLTLTCRVDSYRAGWTVTAFLAHRFPYHTEDGWRRRVERGMVRVNDREVAPDAPVARDDAVSYTIWHAEPPVDDRYAVLHEDDDLLVVAKSGNLPVHACGVYITHTLINRLRADHGPSVNLAHRLDRETSGVVVCTKHRAANRTVARAFAEGRVEKRYLAVVHGRVRDDAFTVDAPIGRLDQRVAFPERYARAKARDLASYLPKRVVDPAGKPARTRVRLLRRLDRFSVVEAVPETGRTNQLRVHLAHVGHPIVGDKIYSLAGAVREECLEHGLTERVRRALVLERHALHCARIAFDHPSTGRRLVVEAPVPDDLRPYLDPPPGAAAGGVSGRGRTT